MVTENDPQHRTLLQQWEVMRLAALVGLCALTLLASTSSRAQSPTFDGVFRGHQGAVFMGVFTPDGQRVITASADETARCWDSKNGQEVKLFKGHTGPVYSVAISGDGRTLVTGSQDNSLALWDVPQTRATWTLTAHPESGSGFSKSLDGLRWVTAGKDNTLRLWDAKALEVSTSKANFDAKSLDVNTVSTTRTGHSQRVLATAIRNDGNVIASADESGRILLWSPFIASPQGSLGVHEGGVSSLAFHSNNQQLVSAGRDEIVRVWQLPPAPALRAEGVATAVRDLAIVPGQALAVVATEDQWVRLVDLNTGKSVRDLIHAEAPVTAVALAPNNSLVAIGTDAGKTRVVNFADGADRFALTGHTGAIRDVLFHPDVQSLFTAGVDGTVRRWQIPPIEGKTDPLRSWEGIAGGAHALALSTDASRLIVGGGDGAIRIYLLADGTLEKTCTGHSDAITELAIVPNSQLIISASRDKSVRQWDTVSGSSQRTLVHSAPVTSVALANNGGRIVSACEDGKLRVWNGPNQNNAIDLPLQEFSEHAVGAAHVQWLPDNQTIVSGSADQSLRIWKPAILQAYAIHSKPILDMALVNGGSHVITTSSDGRVVMTDLGNGQEVRKFEGISGEPRVISPRGDNQRLAIGCSDGKVQVYNTNDAQRLQSLDVGGSITALAWTSDQQRLAIATDQRWLYFYGPPLPPQSAQPGSELVEHDKVMTDALFTGMTWDSDQRCIVGLQEDGRLSKWAYAAPAPVRRFNHGGPVQSVAVSRDGKTVVSASGDQTVRIWDAINGQQRAQLSGHVGQVLAVALSPDESTIVSSGADHTLRLWDATAGTQLKQLVTLPETMYSVAIHPNGQTVAAGGADRRVYLINVLTGSIDRAMEGHNDYVHSVTFHALGTKLISYSYSGDLRCWDVASGQLLSQQKIGRIGNFATYSPDNTLALLSNGDDTARVIELPPQAR